MQTVNFKFTTLNNLKVSNAFHHLGISLGSVIDNMIELLPGWSNGKTYSWFKNKSRRCKSKKNDVCYSSAKVKYGIFRDLVWTLMDIEIYFNQTYI